MPDPYGISEGVKALSGSLDSSREAAKGLSKSIEDAQRIKEQNEALEKIVEERTRSLQASLNNLQEFSYIVSHDLKEPLRTISGFITLLKKDLEQHKALNQTSQEYINYVVNGTHQMEKLIHDILDYSRLNVIEKNFVFIDMNVNTFMNYVFLID
jgi:light-regulated signal transduction histidine kinase (bacteriophytochrome)